MTSSDAGDADNAQDWSSVSKTVTTVGGAVASWPNSTQRCAMASTAEVWHKLRTPRVDRLVAVCVHAWCMGDDCLRCLRVCAK